MRAREVRLAPGERTELPSPILLILLAGSVGTDAEPLELERTTVRLG